MSQSLITATRWGILPAIEQALNDGADINIKAESGDLNGWTALHIAADTNLLQIADLLITRGANINATAGTRDWTPLHAAAARGHLQIITLLLTHGANVQAIARDNRTPLHVAVLRDHPQVVELLLSHNAVVYASLLYDAKKDHFYPLVNKTLIVNRLQVAIHIRRIALAKLALSNCPLGHDVISLIASFL